MHRSRHTHVPGLKPNHDISPKGGDRLVYHADQDTDEVVELFVSYVEATVYLPLILR